MERSELQPLIGAAIAKALTEAGVGRDGAHLRRLVRVLLRAAARIVIDAGAPPQVFLRLALQALADEAAAKVPALALQPIKPARDLN